MNEFEQREIDKIVCPWCEAVYSKEVSEYSQDEEEEYTCDDCGKEFLHTAEVEVTYVTTRKPCENHKYELSIETLKMLKHSYMGFNSGDIVVASFYECSVCGDTEYKYSKPTDDKLKEIK